MKQKNRKISLIAMSLCEQTKEEKWEKMQDSMLKNFEVDLGSALIHVARIRTTETNFWPVTVKKLQ